MAHITLTKDNFAQEVLRAEKPVLVDFWASWCGPCMALAPTVDEVAEEQAAVTVGKVNVDDEPELARQYRIMSIPTLMLFKNGEPVRREVGGKSKAEILEMIGLDPRRLPVDGLGGTAMEAAQTAHALGFDPGRLAAGDQRISR